MLRKEMGEILSLVNLKNDSGCNDLAKHNAEKRNGGNSIFSESEK
jgi:hypothetical protein